jgi:hypothetical protein
MKVRAIALTTSALVAVATLAAPATAGSYAGKMNIGLGAAMEDYDGSDSVDYTALTGSASVNVPYSNFVNLQFDIAGGSSLDNSNSFDSFYGGFAAGLHLNYRDDDGALGVFGGVGRANVGSDWSGDYMVMVAGFEGQYYANAWTLRAQTGYMDSDSNGYLVQEAGFLRAGADYYASKILKISGEVGYLDGRATGTDDDVTTWDWAITAEYAFGKSVPVSAYVEYRGLQTEAWDNEIERDAISVGVRFYFGGENDLQKADREGAGFSMPDMTTLSRYYY